uniref:Cytochrome c biogenesis protein n=1 Tax=Catenella fusiformis TaxID=3024791 RepID=UPI0027DAAD6A|nr:Cytochrome c biogenesis protein [Catenella fusiformis]WCH57429.1 Cytochrome c biogenesis protein [Catenella fusiformis]
MKYLYNKTLQWHITKQLSNLSFSITLFLVIASTSVVGTIIEQDKNIEYYQTNYPTTHSINWKTIIGFGINHLYTSWWFLCLLILFCCSLVTCTFSRQLPELKNARSWKFMPYSNKNRLAINSLPMLSLKRMIFILNSKQYYVFQKNHLIYAYKGLIGRIAPIFVHISIITALTGSMIGLLGGFTAQQMIPTKEFFHIQSITKSGLYSHLPTTIVGRIDNFVIERNQDNSIKQFYSYITLLNNKGKQLSHKLIYVNSPLKFEGTIFYQTAWNINAIKMKIDNFVVQQKLTEHKLNNQRIWVYTLQIEPNSPIHMIITGLQNKISIYNSSGNLLKLIEVKEEIVVNNHSITITELMTSTGLQIKTDPGNDIVYLGFFILISSTMISYLSYSQIWIKHNQQNIQITGHTNRAQLTFEKELTSIQKQYVNTTSAKKYNK